MGQKVPEQASEEYSIYKGTVSHLQRALTDARVGAHYG
jgi:hypothetical protein